MTLKKGKFSKITAKGDFGNKQYLDISMENDKKNNKKYLEIYSDLPQPLLTQFGFFKGLSGGTLFYKSIILPNNSNSNLKIENFKILIHCFTGSKKFAFKLLDLGAYISASGVVTFKKSQDLANTFKEIPNDRILVETDSPYLAPEPLRGKPNEPSYIIHTVKFLSKLKNIPFEDFSKITTKNFFNLFGELN